MSCLDAEEFFEIDNIKLYYIKLVFSTLEIPLFNKTTVEDGNRSRSNISY